MWFKKKKEQNAVDAALDTIMHANETDDNRIEEQSKEQVTDSQTADGMQGSGQADVSKTEAELAWMRRMVSHNVRMPMSIIRGYGDVLRQDLLDEKEKKAAIESICENIMYLDQMIGVIFDSDEIHDSMLTRVNISDIIRKTSGYVKEVARKKQISINVRLESEELYIEAEQTPMMRVFYQIFENAFKYLDTGNTISLLAHSAGDEILIVYKDDGKGMESEEVKRIFEQGFRGSNSKSNQGTGLGLYDVAETVKKYNGMIEAASRPGEGFSIFIRIPKVVVE